MPVRNVILPGVGKFWPHHCSLADAWPSGLPFAHTVLSLATAK